MFSVFLEVILVKRERNTEEDKSILDVLRILNEILDKIQKSTEKKQGLIEYTP